MVDTSVPLGGRSEEFIGEDFQRSAAQEPANALARCRRRPRRRRARHPDAPALGPRRQLRPVPRGHASLVQLAELRYAVAPGRFFRKSFLSPQSGWGTPPWLLPNLETVDGETLVAPGLRRRARTGAHARARRPSSRTPSHGRFCIAGDAISLYENIERDIPPGFHVDVDASVDSMDRLRAKADHFLPGHDYEVFSDGGPTEIGPSSVTSDTTPPFRSLYAAAADVQLRE